MTENNPLTEAGTEEETGQIITVLLEGLGNKEASKFKLTWRQFSGLRIHIAQTEKGEKRKNRRLNMQLLSFSGSKLNRTYEVAVAKERA